MSVLQDFIISRVRINILILFFTNQTEMFYVREITRQIKEEINAVRRELDRMLTVGLLKSEDRGNRVYYFLNKSYLYYPELLRLVAKSSGLGEQILKLRRKLGTVEFVMFSGNFVCNTKKHHGDVDVLIVGDVVLSEVQALMKDEETKRGREINYTVLASDEFEFRKTRRDPFLMEVLYGARILIVGTEEDLVARQIQGVSS